MTLAPTRRSGWTASLVMTVALACTEAPERHAPAKSDSTRVQQVAIHVPPSDSSIPNNDLGNAIRRGRALLVATQDSLPAHVGNKLNCSSCHLAAGTQPTAISLVGVYARFPQYRSRSGRVNLIQDRVNDCFMRSLDGKPLDPLGRDMTDIVAWMAFISRGIPTGGTAEGHGLPKLSPPPGDVARGQKVYAESCARCHGADGQGIAPIPPLWGPHSFTIGAGMARVNTMSAFVRHNMPLDKPGTLSDQDAADVTAFIKTHPRPDFAGKEKDWPRGDPPPDVAYPTAAGRKAPARTSN